MLCMLRDLMPTDQVRMQTADQQYTDTELIIPPTYSSAADINQQRDTFLVSSEIRRVHDASADHSRAKFDEATVAKFAALSGQSFHILGTVQKFYANKIRRECA
jgi:hypothetical protein